MTPDQIRLVQTSFASLADDPDDVASAFYDRLFTLDPKLRVLFKGEMTAQRNRLMAMLAAGVRGLDRIDALLPTLHALGERHVRYRVRDGDYDTVGRALIDTLRAGLGPAFTPDLRTAWLAAYTTLSGAMKAGAAAAAVPATV
jgi:nitric oxide dioxygenase